MVAKAIGLAIEMCNWRTERRRAKVGVLSICDMRKRGIVVVKVSKVEWMMDDGRPEAGARRHKPRGPTSYSGTESDAKGILEHTHSCIGSLSSGTEQWEDLHPGSRDGCIFGICAIWVQDDADTRSAASDLCLQGRLIWRKKVGSAGVHDIVLCSTP